MVNVTLRWSQFQQNGQLIWRAIDFQLYRDCTSNITKAAATTTGLHKLHSYLPLFDDKILLFHRRWWFSSACYCSLNCCTDSLLIILNSVLHSLCTILYVVLQEQCKQANTWYSCQPLLLHLKAVPIKNFGVIQHRIWLWYSS